VLNGPHPTLGESLGQFWASGDRFGGVCGHRVATETACPNDGALDQIAAPALGKSAARMTIQHRRNCRWSWDKKFYPECCNAQAASVPGQFPPPSLVAGMEERASIPDTGGANCSPGSVVFSSGGAISQA
jgi:hypothetical protein